MADKPIATLTTLDWTIMSGVISCKPGITNPRLEKYGAGVVYNRINHAPGVIPRLVLPSDPVGGEVTHLVCRAADYEVWMSHVDAGTPGLRDFELYLMEKPFPAKIQRERLHHLATFVVTADSVVGEVVGRMLRESLR